MLENGINFIIKELIIIGHNPLVMEGEKKTYSSDKLFTYVK